MKLFSKILPIAIMIIAMVLKFKTVHAQDGKKPSISELCIDLVKVCVIAIIAFIGNFITNYSKSMFPFMIDVLMLTCYALPLFQKNYNYAERKAYIGVMASVCFMVILAIALVQMIIRNSVSYMLVACFIKAFCYFIMGFFVSLTSGTKGKIRTFFRELRLIFKNYEPRKLDYFFVSIFTLWFFNSCSVNNTPIPLFGMQEILKKRYFRCVLFLGIGAFVIWLEKEYPSINSVLTFLYNITAIAYLIRQFIVMKKVGT